MRAHYSVLLLAALSLVGCDKITGADDRKMLDAESVGYACRVSRKAPEDCIKENETQSPTFLLNGWKAADRDISEKVLDPSMGAAAASAAAAAPAIAHSAPVAAAAAKVESKAAAEKPAAKPAEKPAKTKGAKPAKNQAKPGKAEPEKKAAP